MNQCSDQRPHGPSKLCTWLSTAASRNTYCNKSPPVKSANVARRNYQTTRKFYRGHWHFGTLELQPTERKRRSDEAKRTERPQVSDVPNQAHRLCCPRKSRRHEKMHLLPQTEGVLRRHGNGRRWRRCAQSMATSWLLTCLQPRLDFMTPVSTLVGMFPRQHQTDLELGCELCPLKWSPETKKRNPRQTQQQECNL